MAHTFLRAKEPVNYTINTNPDSRTDRGLIRSIIEEPVEERSTPPCHKPLTYRFLGQKALIFYYYKDLFRTTNPESIPKEFSFRSMISPEDTVGLCWIRSAEKIEVGIRMPNKSSGRWTCPNILPVRMVYNLG